MNKFIKVVGIIIVIIVLITFVIYLEKEPDNQNINSRIDKIEYNIYIDHNPNQGESLNITNSVKNIGENNVTILFPGIYYDSLNYYFTLSNGSVVYYVGPFVLMVVPPIELPPGEETNWNTSIRSSDKWWYGPTLTTDRYHFPSGSYSVYGVCILIPSDDNSTSTRIQSNQIQFEFL